MHHMRELELIELKSGPISEDVWLITLSTWRVNKLTIYTDLSPSEHWKDLEFLPQNYNILSMDNFF